ncbi:MAG: hypothetical protein KatS3mg057_2962 [Herpetosiphonaceae bacterium]|nr:MAG: hypothetical protein KatS3mg057_2962 [Herpetosiphonaceae bacterium]
MPDTAPSYELDLVVGSPITVRPEEDRETYEQERAWLEEVQDALREEGVEVDLLAQPGTEVWEGGIERFVDLYQLRRLAAHLERGEDISEMAAQEIGDEEEIDPLLADIWEGAEETRYPHLINHQGDGGYYLPVDFSEPIWLGLEEEDDEAGDLENVVSFGSSVALLRELSELVDALRAKKVGRGPMQALEALREGAQQSVNYGLPLILW